MEHPDPHPSAPRGSGRTWESRSLPVYAAGDIELPVLAFGRDEHLERDTVWPPHSHPTHELVWHDAGVGTVAVGPRTWTIAAAVGLWIPAGTLHAGWAPAGTRQRVAHFDVSAVTLAPGPIAVEMTPLLRLLLERLSEPGLSRESHAITEAAVIDVLRPADGELLLHTPANPLLAPIVEAIRADPADSTTLTQWSRRLTVSSRTLTRAFEAETGLGFARWIATARAQRAVELLAAGLPIDEVAHDVGYRSASAFTTAFRRVTGATPGRFRALADA